MNNTNTPAFPVSDDPFNKGLTKREYYELEIAKALIISDRNVALLDVPKMANAMTTKMIEKEYY